MTAAATAKRDRYLDLVLAELDRIAAARNSLADFVAYQLNKTPAAHHRLICSAIDDLLADKYDDLLILTPPNSAKSFYSSIALPPYLLGKQPDAQILAISGTADLAMSWGRQARNNISDPSLRVLFPNLRLADDSRAVDNFATQSGSTYRSFGVSSQVLGQRATILLIDDPLTSAANSLAQLRQLHEWYESEALTRLDPQRGKVILVCQRLDRNDLAGYLMDRNALKATRRLKVLTLKMECEPGDNDPLGRQPGERLWPERFTESWVEDAKRDGYKWQTLYQQHPPSDTGQWCQADWLQFVDHAPQQLKVYLASDLALSVGKGDFSVHIAVGIDAEGRLYVLDAWRDRCGIVTTVEQHLHMIRMYSPLECLIDDDNASRMYSVALADRARAAATPCPWKPLPLRGQDKETRAAPLRSLLQQRRVFLVRAPWNDWLTWQLTGFPVLQGDGVDDGVDALSLIGRRLLALARPAAPPSSKPAGNPNGTFFDANLNELFANNELGSGNFGRNRI